jgi:hypothetical protein
MNTGLVCKEEEDMDINITAFIANNARDRRTTLLTTPEQIEALREHVKDFGAWDDEEIAAWDDIECNAIFVQLVSGDMREAGMDDVDIDDFDWETYNDRVEAGELQGNIYYHRQADKIFYSLIR